MPKALLQRFFDVPYLETKLWITLCPEKRAACDSRGEACKPNDTIDTMTVPTQTERLLFAAWTEQDGELAEALWCDPDVMSHMGGALSPEQARSRLQGQLELGRERGVQYWPIRLRANHEFVGCCGLRPWIEAPETFEMGCHIMRAGWGKRYGEEACRSVLAYGFEDLRLPLIVAGHKVSNSNSAAMIGRLGFSMTRQAFYAPGGFDAFWYELKEEQWRRHREFARL